MKEEKTMKMEAKIVGRKLIYMILCHIKKMKRS